MRLRAGRWARLLTGMGMRPPLFLPLLTLALYLLWRGYDYAISDQDEVIPYLLHLLNPSLYTSDWFVGVQTEAFGPRTLFVWLAWLPARLFGPYLTIAGMYILTWWGTASALYALGLQLTRERLAAAIGVVLAVLFTPKFTLGGNDIVTWILTPSMSAWALGLWGLVYFVRGRSRRGAVLMGLATWMQALVGLQLALLSGLLLLWRHGLASRRTWTFTGVYTLAALPALGPLIWFQLSRLTPKGSWSYFYMLFEFRAPHHYLPTSFTLESAVGFVILTVLGLSCFRMLPSAQKPLVQRALMLIAAFCVVGFLCTEVLRVDTVAKLQLFKFTVVAKLLFVIAVSNAIALNVVKHARRYVEVFFDHGHYALGATLLLVATLVIVSPDALGLWQPEAATPPEEVAIWARDHTDQDALFAVPPQWAHFRSQAQRAIVINFKAIPFHEPYMTEWFARLLDIAPVELPRRGGLALLQALDAAYLALSPDEVRVLADKYGFDYIIRSREAVPEGFTVEYESGSWAVWRILPAS